ncbi:MAG: PspC domain-containing protein [Clostridia bacterium]|nr:PspC domain-containing protein [Clostridia bacterium]
MARRLYRSRRNAVLGGVCGGMGEYFDIDPVLVRIIWLIALFSGVGLVAYLACWLVIPQRPAQETIQKNTPYEDGYYDESYHQESGERKQKTKLLLGAALIIMGSFSLMQRFMPWFDFDLIWPMLLILGGFYLIYREKDDHDEE